MDPMGNIVFPTSEGIGYIVDGLFVVTMKKHLQAATLRRPGPMLIGNHTCLSKINDPNDSKKHPKL